MSENMACSFKPGGRRLRPPESRSGQVATAALAAVLMLSGAGLCAHAEELNTVPAFGPPGAPIANAPASVSEPQELGLSPLAPSFSNEVTIGLNQQLSSGSTNGFIPPDTMGSVGPNHIVEMINGSFRVFSKTTGALLPGSSSLDGFWTGPAGQTIPPLPAPTNACCSSPSCSNFTFDPRIVFDPVSNRWFAASIDADCVANNAPGVYGGNRIYVAVSATSDPTGAWNGFRFNADTEGNEFHDYDTLAVNADALVICTNDFDDGGHESCYSFPKSDLLTAVPNWTQLSRFEALANTVSGSYQPALSFDASDGCVALLGSSGSSLVRRNLCSAWTAAPILGSEAAIGGTGHSGAPAARQPTAATLENVTPRIVANVFEIGGSLWAVNAVAGTSSNSAIRWYEIDQASSAVVQTGLIEDTATPRDFHEPSIAVNDNGDVVIGYTCSGPSLYASTCVSVGKTVSGTTTFLSPQILTGGVGNYYKDYGGGRNRWGDYSATVIDPVDPCTFWTFQEFVAVSGGATPNAGSPAGEWGTAVTQLTINTCRDAQATDLAVTKSCKPDGTTAADGVSVAECTMTVRNWGPSAANGVKLNDRLTKGTGNYTITAITTTQGTCTPSPVPPTVTVSTSPYDINCDIGALAKDATATVTVKLTATAPIDVNDTATVTSATPDNDKTNNTATGKVSFAQPEADLAITKLCKPDPGPWHAGEANPPYCEIVVTNIGPATAKGVSFKDRVVGSASYKISGVTDDPDLTDICGIAPGFGTATTSSDVNCTLTSDLPQGANWTVRVNYTADQATDINDEATVTADTTDTNTNNNTAKGVVHVANSADLQAFSVFGAEVQTNGLPGKSIDTNALPTMPDPTCCNFGGTTVTAGRRIEWNTSAINAGPSPAKNVVIEVLLPQGASVIENTLTALPNAGTEPGRCTTESAGELRKKVICTYDKLDAPTDPTPTTTAALRFQVLMDPSLPVGTQFSFDSNARSDTWDKNLSNNVTSIQFDSNAWADLNVTKTAVGPTPWTPGAVQTYLLEVDNNGPSLARNVHLTDQLPAGVTFQSAYMGINGPGGVQLACNVAAGNLDCLMGDIAVTGTEKPRVYVNVLLSPSLPDGGTLDNSATVSANTGDPKTTDNTTPVVSVGLQAKADLWIDKVQNYPTGNPSATVIYTLTAYNKPGCEKDDQKTCWNQSGGPSDAQNVVVTDHLPWTADKFLVQYVSTGCLYDKPTHTVTCNAGTLAYGQSASFEIQVKTNGSLGTKDNTATVSSATFDPVGDNDSDTVTTTVKGGTGKTGGSGSGRGGK
jgi:uncharacterized repeat protein (TIGR01451 family)